ncbi:MAG TPA: type VI secretion system-associated protein TagO [Vineibacter sp.]|nr:type VI secretion system-associated protein TagO [Vineibacter sp.]
MLVLQAIFIGNTFAQPAPSSDLAADLSRTREQIAAAEKELANYQGGLVFALVQVRLETLKLSEALLEARIKSMSAGVPVEIKSPQAQPDPERAAKLLQELKQAQDRVTEAEKNAARYSGGLVQALAISELVTRRQTAALLEQNYLIANYGLFVPQVTASTTAVKPQDPKSTSTMPAESPPASPKEHAGLQAERAVGNEIVGSWSLQRTKSPVNDFPNIAGLAFDDASHDARTANSKLLLVGCHENETRLVTHVDSFLLGRDDMVDVIYRIDDAPAVSTRWNISTTHKWTGIWSQAGAVPLIKSLLGRKQLFIQVTERNGERHRATFQLEGIEVVAAQVAKACGWQLAASPQSGDSQRAPDAKRVQEALRAAGVYTGVIDGQIGPGTKAAIGRFQAQKGLRVTGELDEATRGALGL